MTPGGLFRQRYLVLFFMLVSSILLAGCNESPKQEIVCSGASTKEQITSLLDSGAKFADFFVPVDTVYLETTDNSIIGTIYQVEKHPNGYIVLDSRVAKQVYFFDKKGKFIKILASKGQGPTEYKDPEFIYIDIIGKTHLLDPTLRKILTYDSEGQLIEEINFRELGIRPSEFLIAGENNELYVFYNIGGDFYGKSKKRKIVVTQKSGDRLKYKYAFGTPEPLLSKLFFNMGSFAITPNNEIWLSEIFGLNLEIYSLNGQRLKTITDAYELLPEPHITPQALDKFDKISQSVETYYKLTRASRHIFLDDVVLGMYFKNPYTYFIFFDYCGDAIPKILTTDQYPFPSRIAGVWDNKIYFFQEREEEADAAGMIPNPMLIGYTIQGNVNVSHAVFSSFK